MPAFPIFAERFCNNPLNFIRNFRRVLLQRSWLLTKSRRDYFTNRFPIEGATTGDHLIQHYAEAKYVCASVNRLPACLLRRHVTRSAEHYPRFSFNQREVRALESRVFGLSVRKFG